MSDASGAGIASQRFALAAGSSPGVAVQQLLPGAVEGVRTALFSLRGPVSHPREPTPEQDAVYLVLEGTGTLAARGERFPLEAETIARLPVGWGCEIRVPHGESLHFVLIRKRLEPPDRAELETHAANNSGAYVRRFRDCPRYGESIKSERTVSRTLLPENVVPRMAAGSVEAVGPDEVGAHRHPMLDQLWLGLRGHDVTVHADGASVRMRENELLHIPLGSTHGASVGAGNRMHYVWLDFFESVEAQQWLRQHNPLPAAPQDGAEL